MLPDPARRREASRVPRTVIISFRLVLSKPMRHFDGIEDFPLSHHLYTLVVMPTLSNRRVRIRVVSRFAYGMIFKPTRTSLHLWLQFCLRSCVIMLQPYSRIISRR